MVIVHISADLMKRPEQVSTMFDEVAAGYDRSNLVLSAGQSALWRLATIAAIDPQPGQRILDLAAGTGASSAPLAARGAQVTAADFSAGMIEEGRRRHPGIEFVQADAMALPFADESFDTVTMSFGLRNVSDPLTALTELQRVTRPGGRVVVCEFSRVQAPLLRDPYRWYLRHVLPKVATFVGTNTPAYRYLAESILDWPDQRGLGRLMRLAGWESVAYRNLTFGVAALHRATKPGESGIPHAATRH